MRNQVPLPVRYEEVIIEVGYRIDLLVGEISYRRIEICRRDRSRFTKLNC